MHNTHNTGVCMANLRMSGIDKSCSMQLRVTMPIAGQQSIFPTILIGCLGLYLTNDVAAK
jgi:hypothetical protein